MACFIIGDSLAVGVGQFRPECQTEAKVGITSGAYLATYLPAEGVFGETVVISLGVNDGDTSGTIDNLRFLRTRVKAAAVYWLLPGLKEEVRAAIRDVARAHGDRLIDTRPEVGRDHLHPSGAGYQRLAALTTGDRRGDVEVAYAPTELWTATRPGGSYPARFGAIFPTRFGATYPTHLGTTYPTRTSFAAGPTTPRERIRRQRALRSAEMSAAAVRHGASAASARIPLPPPDARLAALGHPASAGLPTSASRRAPGHGSR